MTDVLTASQSSTHSWFLHHLLGAGILGLAAFLGIVAIALLQVWRDASSPAGVAPAIGAVALLAYLAQGLVTINSITTDLLLWTALGLIATGSGHDGGDAARSAIRLDRIAAVAALLVGAAVGTTVLNVIESDSAVRTSNLARDAGNFPLAQRAGELAVQEDPGRPDHWNVLGLAYSRLNPQRARAAFAEAARRAPSDPVYRLNAASEEAFLVATASRSDLRDTASTGADAAIRLDPNGPVTLRRASEVFAAIGHLERALTAARAARDLVPSDPYVHDWLAELLERSGRRAEAIQELELAISLQPSYASTPRLDLPTELRLRLSRLYAAVGRLDEARAVIRPPHVSSVDTACEARNGLGVTLTGVRKPLCVRVLFSTEQSLRDDGSDASVRNVGNYLVDGMRLPAGAVVESDGGHIATLQLPAGAAPPLRITIAGVANLIGQVAPTAEWPVP